MRTTGIIFAIMLLASSLASAQEYTKEWHQEKEQSWARAKNAYPESAVKGPFYDRMVEIHKWAQQNNPSLYNNSDRPYLLAQMVYREFKEQSWARAKVDYPESAVNKPFYDRMVEIDNWAKQNNPSLYKNSNKPYLMAQIVQREVDEARARQTTPNAPPITPSPSARPAVSTRSPQPSNSPALQQIVQSHTPSSDRPSIWLGAIIIVAIASAVAYLFLRIVRPKHGVKTAVALGRRWAAWTGFFTTFAVLPEFFRKFDGSSLAIWILAIGFFTPVAFVIGWIIGLVRYRKSTIGLHQGNPPEKVEVKDLKSPPKTVRLTTVKPPPTTVLLTTAKGPSMNKDILTDKLRLYAELGNIEMERCIEIALAANDAIIKQSKGGDLNQMAAAMLRCCSTDEDEAAYFRCAVDSLLREKWGAKPQDSSSLTGLMNMAYQGLVSAQQVGRSLHQTDATKDAPYTGGDVFRRTIRAARQGVVQFNRMQDHITFGVQLDRHKWIIDHAKSAVKSYAKSHKIDTLALTMVNCCNSTEELKFYSYAVKSFLCENGSKEEDAIKTSNWMGHRAIEIAETRRGIETKTKSTGCLGLLAIVGILPFGIYFVRFFQG